MCCSEYHKRISRCSPGWRRSQNHWCIPSNGNIYSGWVCFCLEETQQARQVSCAYMQRLIVCATKLIALTYATKTYALFCISQLQTQWLKTLVAKPKHCTVNYLFRKCFFMLYYRTQPDLCVLSLITVKVSFTGNVLFVFP